MMAPDGSGAMPSERGAKISQVQSPRSLISGCSDAQIGESGSIVSVILWARGRNDVVLSIIGIAGIDRCDRCHIQPSLKS
jgi:hypothetical protein